MRGAATGGAGEPTASSGERTDDGGTGSFGDEGITERDSSIGDTCSTCREIGAECGVIDDECGVQLDCGCCGDGYACGPDNLCVLDDPWTELASFSVFASTRRFTYSNAISDPSLRDVGFMRVEASCPLEQVSRLSAYHWTGSRNMAVSETLLESNGERWVYRVGDGSGIPSIDNFDCGTCALSRTVEVAVAAGRALV